MLLIVGALAICSILNAVPWEVFGLKLGDYILKIAGVVGICMKLEECL